MTCDRGFISSIKILVLIIHKTEAIETWCVLSATRHVVITPELTEHACTVDSLSMGQNFHQMFRLQGVTNMPIFALGPYTPTKFLSVRENFFLFFSNYFSII